MSKKIIAFLISFVFLFEQIGFAQVANVIDLSGSFSSVSSINKFRPLHLRSLVYDRIKDDFTLLLDKGDNKNIKPAQLKDSIAKMMEYFQIGVALPDNSFWVNLRPDGKDDIIDPAVGKTDLGKVLLEADLQLKKDMALATSPKTREGKIYWKRLYEKAESLLGGGEINIPTMTRPWIVPGEIIVKQSADSAYVYKATLKVMLEQDYLKNSATYGFDDPRLKELNEYSSGLIREVILPKLTKKVNSAKEYAPLRQVYYSLVLAQWFKKNSGNIPVEYSRRINTKELSGLISKTAWSKETYFKAYHKSFASGEYNTQETVSGLNGMNVRRYFSGGITLMPVAGTDVAVITQKTPIVPADVLAVEDKNYRPVNNDQQARDGGEAESEGRGDLKDNVEVGFRSSSRKISAGGAAAGSVNKVPVSKLQGISAAAFLGFLGAGTMLMLAAKFIGLAEFGWIIGPIALVCALISGIVYERARDRDQKAFSSAQPAVPDGGVRLSGMGVSRPGALIGGLLYFTAGSLFFASGVISANPVFYLTAGFSFLAAGLSLFWVGKTGRSDNHNHDGGSDIRAYKITKEQRSRAARAISSLINATDVVAVTSFFTVVVAPLLSISGYAVVLALSLVWKDIGVMFFQLPPVISVPSSIFIGAASILGLDKASYTFAYLIDTRIDDFEGPAAKRQQDGGFFAPSRSRTDELSSAIEEIGWMRSADRDFVDRRLDRVKTLIQDNKYTPDEINTVISSIDTKGLDEWLFARKANTALMLGGFVIVGGLTLAAFLISGPVLLPMVLGATTAALSGIAGGYSLHKLITQDIPVRDLTSEYYNEAAKMLNAAVLAEKNNSGALNSDGGKTDLTPDQAKLEDMFQGLRVSLRQVRHYPGGVAADEGYGGGELDTESLAACVKKVITSREEFERMMEYINDQVTIADSKWYSFIPTPRAAALVNAYNMLGLLGSSNTLKFDKDSAGPLKDGYVRLNNGFTAPADLTQKIWEGLKAFREDKIFAAFDLAMAARFPGVFVLSKKEKADAIAAGLLKADGSFDQDTRNIIISSCDGAGVMEFAARNPALNTAARDGGEAYGFEVNKLLDQLKANDFTGQLEGAANGASYEAVKKIGNGKLSELGFEPLKGEWVNRLGWTITNLKAIRDGSAGRTLEDVINDGKELKEKYKYVIFCGMGGSGLSVQFVKDTFKNEAAENIYSLRTTDPTVITLMLKEIAEKEGGLKAALDKTAIVLISKSATTPETVAHRKYFEGVYNALGLDTQKNLWFITDTISPWGVEAQGNPAMRQREIQLNGRGDVGGRFTAPGTNVFLLPMAVVAPDSIIPIIDNAIAMNSVKDDPFLRLGAFMAHMAKDLHKDKLTIIVPPALRSYPMWAEQLIEESLGKFGKGITLFYDEGALDVSALKPVDSNDRVFLRINLGMRKPQADLWKYLNDNGYPTYEIALNDLEDIGGLMLGMQRAVAVFGYLWDICFVNQPAVEGYKIASKLMDTEIINAGGDVKKVLNSIYPAASKKGALTLYYDPLIQMGAVNIGDIQAHVRLLGSTMDDPAAVYAALIFLLKDKIEAGEFTSYGNMTDNLKAVFEGARAEVFTRGLKMPAKLGVGPDKNHAYQQNIEDGKNMFFSTYFLPLQAIQPKEFDLLKGINGFSDSMIKAQTLGTVQSMIKNNRKVVLITSDLTAQDSETEMAEFFAAVIEHLTRNEASVAEKNTRDGGDVGGEVKDIGYLHNNLKDPNSAVRGSAARDLAVRKDKRSVAPLIAALKAETMPGNRYAIARALAAIGPEAIGPLMLVATEQNIKSQIREEAAAAINSIQKGMNDGGAAEIRELYAKAALYSPQIKPLLDILTDDTVSFEAQLEAARLLIAQPAGKKFILENKEILSREIGIMMVLLDNPRFDGGTGIYSTQGLKDNLEDIGSYDYKKVRDLAMILAKRILKGELSAYFAGRLTVIGDVSVDGPVTIGYKETPSDTITILSVSSTEQRQKGVRVNSVSPIQIKVNKLNKDIVLVGIDKQVVVPGGLSESEADGGKMPTDARFNAWDPEGKVKRDDNDKYSGAARESSGGSSSEVNTGDNVFDGGDKMADPVGGIDFRGMPVISQPAIGAGRIPVLPNLVGVVALEELNKQWMEIRTSMVQGPMPYLKIQEYIACCNARPDSSKQIQAVTNCVADILKAEEEDALPTCGQLKEILIQLG